MKRAIYILCEGQTEEEFVNQILRPYFHTHQVYDVRPILMATSKGKKGGDVNYNRLKSNIEKLLRSEQDILVTTFIDFFRLKNDFPRYEAAQKKQDKFERVTFLEQAMADAINTPRFIPYIQLHEFEGLLFASKDGFEFLPDIKPANLRKLLAAVQEKDNPEELNDGELTAPSKRLGHWIPGFDKNKPLYGAMIAEINTIQSILMKCTRFNHWVKTIIQKMQE